MGTAFSGMENCRQMPEVCAGSLSAIIKWENVQKADMRRPFLRRSPLADGFPLPVDGSAVLM